MKTIFARLGYGLIFVLLLLAVWLFPRVVESFCKSLDPSPNDLYEH